jgi:N-acetyl-gamma-glutamyl-phosphate reductase
MAEGTSSRLIDASTAHRTNPAWDYGLPELNPEQRRRIISSSRVAVPGCHASGFIAVIWPLIASGLLSDDYPLSALSLTGYSGGGKDMIADYENAGRNEEYARARMYGLEQIHKHLPEMTHVCGLVSPPVFTPILEDFYSGMMVTVPLHTRMLSGSPGFHDVCEVLVRHFEGQKLISVTNGYDGSYMPAAGFSGRDDMEICVSGNDDRIILTARYDNLGKGASGAAIQCLNLMIGADETSGLVLR